MYYIWSSQVVCMALHAIAILSTSRACMDLSPSLTTSTTGTEATPTKTKSSGSKSSQSATHTPSAAAGKPEEGQKVMRLTPCPGNEYFRLFIVELLKMFDKDNRILLEKKGSFIIRSAATIYCTVCVLCSWLYWVCEG